MFWEPSCRCCWTGVTEEFDVADPSFIVMLPLLGTSHEKYPTEVRRLFCGDVQLDSCGWVREVRHAFIVQRE